MLLILIVGYIVYIPCLTIIACVIKKLHCFAEINDDECKKEHPNVWFGIICMLMVIVGLLGNIFVAVIIVTLKEYKKSVANL